MKFENNEKIFSEYENKTILITGACGSIGYQIVKKLSECKNIYLICIDINEEKMMELFLFFKNKNFKNFSLILCNLSNLDEIDNIFKSHKPDYCFHAAAIKHVPFVEKSPEIAIQTNIMFTINLTKIAFENKIKKFVFISTDKAVNPNNIMGLTKRIAEIYLLNLKKKNPNFDIRIIRFGNVLNSSGSVIPIFKRNIAYGKKIQVTHPEIKRYFMSIQDAVKLVLISNTINVSKNNFDIFILDMGEQIKILDLAKKFLFINNLSQTMLDENFLGLRDGEKLYEELNYSFEIKTKTNIKNIFGIILDDNIKFVTNNDIVNFLNKKIPGNNIKQEMMKIISLKN